MTDHLELDQLCDLADGALAPDAEAHARAHLRDCEQCSASMASLATLGVAASALPREIEPPQDLWNDIRAELRPRRARATGGLHWPHWRMAAAAALIAVASSAITMLVVRSEHGAPVQRIAEGAAPQRVVVVLPAGLAVTEDGYTRNVDALMRVLAERRDSLAPSTVETVERSLRVADSAIAEARAALTRDPGNAQLVKLFASNYERKIDLLKRASELAPRT